MGGPSHKPPGWAHRRLPAPAPAPQGQGRGGAGASSGTTRPGPRWWRRFGRHAADTTRWSGGCGGCWSPSGHRPGWCHLQKCFSSGAFRGRVPALRKAVLIERRVFSRDVPANLPSRKMWRDKLLRSSSDSWQSVSSRSTTPSRMGAKWDRIGGSWKAPSVRTRDCSF